MCTGIEPLALAALVGGTAASGIGAKMNSDAQNAAIEANNALQKQNVDAVNLAQIEETERQNAMEEEQMARITEALVDANPAAVRERVERMTRSPESPAPKPTSYNRPQTTARSTYKNADVDRAAAGYVDKKASTTEGIVDALERMTAFNTDFSTQSGNIAQIMSDNATTGLKRRGSANAHAMEARRVPGVATPSTSPIGDILILGGKAASGYGGKGLPDIGDLLAGRK